MGSSATDWRYDNLRPLQGAAFRFDKYRAPTDQWDHDHCDGCWAEFADGGGPDILHEGYVRAHPYVPRPVPEFIKQARERGDRCIAAPVVSGCTLQWVCSD